MSFEEKYSLALLCALSVSCSMYYVCRTKGVREGRGRGTYRLELGLGRLGVLGVALALLLCLCALFLSFSE